MPGNDFVGPDWRGAVPHSRQNKNVPRDSNARFRHIIPTKQSLDRIAAVRRDQVPPRSSAKLLTQISRLLLGFATASEIT
jgi:hypothetical protein